MLKTYRTHNKRITDSRMEEGEVSGLVSQIVGITNVSEDEALFALNDCNFDLALAIDAVMKFHPDEKVQQKTSRRKKTSTTKEAEDVIEKEGGGTKEGSKKDSKDKQSKMTERSQNRHPGRREKGTSSKSRNNIDTNSNAQVVKPLMEIQTGNWQDEGKMMNGFDTFGHNSDASTHRDRFSSHRRGGRGRGGVNRTEFRNRNDDKTTFEDSDNGTSSFSQPFVVGTFDAKAVTSDGTQKAPLEDRSHNSFDRASRGGRGGGRFGRGGGFSGRHRGSNRDKKTSANDDPLSTAGPTPLDSLWPHEEKWDVNCDGDWRGREFTRTDVNEVSSSSMATAADSSLASATLNYYAAGSEVTNAPLTDMAANSGATTTTVNNMSNGDVNSIDQYAGMFDSVNHVTGSEQSENLIMKLLQGGMNQDSRTFESAKNSEAVSSLQASANHFMNLPHAPSVSQNEEPSVTSMGPGSCAEVPDVPPGFTETLNSENLEFGQPPSSVLQNRKQTLSNMPTAPVELPSPVSSFSVGKPVNFGEIDPRYVNGSRATTFNVTQPGAKKQAAMASGKGVEFYNSRFSSTMGADVSFVNASHDINMQASLGDISRFASGQQTNSASPRAEVLNISKTPSGSNGAPTVSQSPGATSRLSSAYTASGSVAGLHQNSHTSTNGAVRTASGGVDVSVADQKYGHRHHLVAGAQPQPPMSSNTGVQSQSVLYQLQSSPNPNASTGGVTGDSGDSYLTPAKGTPDKATGNSYFASSPSSSVYNKMTSPAVNSTGAQLQTGGVEQQQKGEQQLRYTGQHSNNVYSRQSASNSYPHNYPKSGQNEDGSGSKMGNNNSSLNSSVANLMSAAAALSSNSQQQGTVSLTNQYHHLHQQQMHMGASPGMNSLGVTSPTGGFQMNYVATAMEPSAVQAAQGGLMQNQHVSNAQQVRYAQHPNAAPSSSHQYQVVSSSVSGGYNQFQTNNSNVRSSSMDHGASNHSGQNSYSMNLSNTGSNMNKMSGGGAGNTARRMDDSGPNNNSPTLNVNTQNVAQATGATAAPAMPYFLPFHAGTNFGNSGNPGAFFGPAAAAAFLTNPAAAVFTPFSPLAQFQAIQQHQQSPGQSPASSISGGASSNVAQASSVQAKSQQQHQQQQSQMSASNNGNLNSSPITSQGYQGPSSVAQFQNSYFQGVPHQGQQNASEYMSEYAKYGQNSQQHPAVIGNHSMAPQSFAGGRPVASGTMGGVSNKSAIYANTNSDYSSLYHGKGLDKNAAASGGTSNLSLGSAGLASTSPPHGNANAPFNAYLAANAYGAQNAATQQQMYSQQFLAAQSHLVHQDPRASSGGALKMGPQSNVAGSMGLHAKHATPGASGQHASASYGGVATGAGVGNYMWHS